MITLPGEPVRACRERSSPTPTSTSAVPAGGDRDRSRPTAGRWPPAPATTTGLDHGRDPDRADRQPVGRGDPRVEQQLGQGQQRAEAGEQPGRRAEGVSVRRAADEGSAEEPSAAVARVSAAPTAATSASAAGSNRRRWASSASRGSSTTPTPCGSQKATLATIAPTAYSPACAAVRWCRASSRSRLSSRTNPSSAPDARRAAVERERGARATGRVARSRPSRPAAATTAATVIPASAAVGVPPDQQARRAADQLGQAEERR